MENDRRLLGTITDGDIRRVLLEKLSLEVSLEQILAALENSDVSVAKKLSEVQSHVERAPIISRTTLSGRCKNPTFAFTPRPSERAVE